MGLLWITLSAFAVLALLLLIASLMQAFRAPEDERAPAISLAIFSGLYLVVYGLLAAGVAAGNFGV